jgi:hypothetical protein
MDKLLMPGPHTLVNCIRHSRKPLGSSTCSITSIAHTTSKVLPSSTSFSAAVCRYSSVLLRGGAEEALEVGDGKGELTTRRDGSRAACA